MAPITRPTAQLKGRFDARSQANANGAEDGDGQSRQAAAQPAGAQTRIRPADLPCPSAAHSKGARLGNRRSPGVAAAKGRAASLGQADRFAGEIIPIICAIQRAGITSLRGIAEALEARGVRTARGGRWQVSNVRNVLRRQHSVL